MTLDEALCDVKIAFLQVEFSIKILSYCQQKKINPSEFDLDEIVLLENGNLHFPTGHFRSWENIVRAASVTVASALGNSALVLNDAWEAAGVGSDPDSDDETIKLRTLVYMIRCAYAHGISNPIWQVQDKYKRVIEVSLPDETITLDLCRLNGKRFEFSTLGGHANWFKIRNATDAVLIAINSRNSD